MTKHQNARTPALVPAKGMSLVLLSLGSIAAIAYALLSAALAVQRSPEDAYASFIELISVGRGHWGLLGFAIALRLFLEYASLQAQRNVYTAKGPRLSTLIFAYLAFYSFLFFFVIEVPHSPDGSVILTQGVLFSLVVLFMFTYSDGVRIFCSAWTSDVEDVGEGLSLCAGGLLALVLAIAGFVGILQSARCTSYFTTGIVAISVIAGIALVRATKSIANSLD